MKLIEFLPKIVKLIRKYPDKEITITSFPEELSSDDKLIINISHLNGQYSNAAFFTGPSTAAYYFTELSTDRR